MSKQTAAPIVWLAILLNCIGASGVVAQSEKKSKIELVDVTSQSGIDFVHSTGGSGLGYIVEGVVGGIATLDFDNDGWIDIYFTNGTPLKGNSSGEPTRHALYRNLGGWKFEDVTVAAGLDKPAFGLGVTVADYDNDGDQDLYLNNFGPNILYRNNGDRTFTDVTEEAGVANGNRVGAGATFLDIDKDGWLDLYVGNYVDFSFENHVPIKIGNQYVMAGPQYYKSVPATLYRNLGNGRFQDVSDQSGIGALAGPAMGVVSADFDRDQDMDIFVAQDGAMNLLWQNDGKGHFEEVGLLSGIATDLSGKLNGNMGVDVGDFDRDGKFDFFVTNYQSEIPVLFRNLGRDGFEDATRKARIPNELYPHVTWGTAFVDFDNDGDEDLFVACGHFDRVEAMDDRTKLAVPNFLLENDGHGKFIDISRQAGTGLQVIASSRGVAFDDLDNDGDVDGVVLNSSAAPTLMRNDSQTNGAKWLQVEVRGGKKNRDAIGTVVEVTASGFTQVRTVTAARGYQSSFGRRLHFGLGASSEVTGRVISLEGVEVELPKEGVGRLIHFDVAD